MKAIVSTDKAPAAIGPYAQAVKTNGLIITSGQLPIDPATGAFDLARANLLQYAHGNYYATGDHLGRFGFSVRKKK